MSPFVTILAAASIASAAPDRMTDVSWQQQLAWASSGAANPFAAREPSLAKLRPLGLTDHAAGIRAQALLLKWEMKAGGSVGRQLSDR